MGMQINATQARRLIEVLQDFTADEPVELSKRVDGRLVVEFVLTTVTIDTSGETEEN